MHEVQIARISKALLRRSEVSQDLMHCTNSALLFARISKALLRSLECLLSHKLVSKSQIHLNPDQLVSARALIMLHFNAALH